MEYRPRVWIGELWRGPLPRPLAASADSQEAI